MKYKEMQLICNKYRKCDKCPLNCIEDWNVLDTKKPTWCIKNMHERYENKYRMHMERGEKEKAKETIEEYINLEQKYLKKTD